MATFWKAPNFFIFIKWNNLSWLKLNFFKEKLAYFHFGQFINELKLIFGAFGRLFRHYRVDKKQEKHLKILNKGLI